MDSTARPIRSAVARPLHGQPFALVNPTLDELLRQARRLRFSDARLEARYEEDRFVAGMMRERVTMACCALVSGVLGLGEAYLSRGLHAHPGLVTQLAVLRFGGVIPLWVALCAATFWRGFPRRAGVANAVVTVLSCWGHGLMLWLVLRAEPGRNLSAMLAGSTILVLVVALLMLPMRFRALLLTVVLSLGGTLGFFYFTLGGEAVHQANLRDALFQVPLITLLVVLGGWFREAADRRMFAQREHARCLVEELAAANAELARLNAEKNEFMAIAAHDLRAPLATVRGFAELLRDDELRDAERRRGAVGEIHAQATRMLGLVTGYLGAHAAENASLPLRCERIDLVAHARAARERHAPAAQAKAQALAGPNGAAPVWARADPALLAQIADNFVSNAIKFSPRAAPIRLEVAATSAGVRFAVIDGGPGIAVEEQAALFQKFGRTSARPTAGEASFGLGLAVARRLAEAMGGRVGCESTAGRGATFWVELPAND